MIAYVDASVLLRFALGQPDALPEWRQIERGVSSALIRTESLHTLDRLRLRANLADAEVAKRRATVLAVIASLEVQPMPTELGTLDAIHVAIALLWKEMRRVDLVMATHDQALALGAQAHGLPVVGVPLH